MEASIEIEKDMFLLEQHITGSFGQRIALLKHIREYIEPVRSVLYSYATVGLDTFYYLMSVNSTDELVSVIQSINSETVNTGKQQLATVISENTKAISLRCFWSWLRSVMMTFDKHEILHSDSASQERLQVPSHYAVPRGELHYLIKVHFNLAHLYSLDDAKVLEILTHRLNTTVDCYRAGGLQSAWKVTGEKNLLFFASAVNCQQLDELVLKMDTPPIKLTLECISLKPIKVAKNVPNMD